MESQALDTGASPKTVGSSATHRSQTGGFSPTRLARMHDTVLRHVDGGRLPGLVALISRRGAEHVDAIGTLGFDDAAPMRRDTISTLYMSTAEPTRHEQRLERSRFSRRRLGGCWALVGSNFLGNSWVKSV